MYVCMYVCESGSAIAIKTFQYKHHLPNLCESVKTITNCCVCMWESGSVIVVMKYFSV
jgi:hypothetical protein